MEFVVQVGDRSVRCNSSEGRSIAIRMQFDGPQPNHFGVERSQDQTVEIGDFVGDTNRGGSCNVDQLTLIPHCNGTHTETVGHIVGDDVPVADVTIEPWMMARLVSVRPVSARDTGESYRPELDHHDMLVTAEMLRQSLGNADLKDTVALVIRTLPNAESKKTTAWGQPQHPAFLTIEAMNWIVQQGIRHLLLDLPSVDKMYDEGLLTNHHLFWNVPEGTHGLTDGTRVDQTITEMVFIDDELKDGFWLLNLQFPAFVSDAAPSRPILFPLGD